MIMAYKSKFIKADRRTKTSGQGFVCHTSHHELVTITDINLSSSGSIHLDFSGKDQHIILPVSGATQLSLNGTVHTIASEEMLLHCGGHKEQVTATNPFEDITVNLLHIAINSGAHIMAPDSTALAAIDITARNRLFTASGAGKHIHVGIYDSRTKDHLLLRPGSDSIYTYIINGSFDFEDRLMEYRDGLFQWDLKQVDFEALSDTAVLLTIECSLTK
jgi:hypothetical protein